MNSFANLNVILMCMLLKMLLYIMMADCFPQGLLDAEIVEFTDERKGDGTYSYSFKTSNGIYKSEEKINEKTVNGFYAYFGPDGKLYKVKYTADENGYRPKVEQSEKPLGKVDSPRIGTALLETLNGG